MKTTGIVVALIATAALPALAADIRPGLWEMAVQTKLPGNMAMPDVSSLPPELLAKLEQKGVRLAGGGSGGTVTARACVTPEQAKNGELPQSPDGRCRSSNVSRSGDMITWQMTCQEQGRTLQGNGQAILLSPTNYVGKSTVTVSDPQHGSLSTTSDISGRWLSAACN